MGDLMTRRDMRRNSQADGTKQRGKRLFVGLLTLGVVGALTLGGTSAAFAADGTTDETPAATDVATSTPEATTEATTESTPATTEPSTPVVEPEPEAAPAVTTPEPATTTPSTESAPAATQESTPTTESAPTKTEEPAATQPSDTSSKTAKTTESSSKTNDFDWNWTYSAPTGKGLTVKYPSNIPSGSDNKDVNIRVKNLATGETITLNFHDSNFKTSGKTVSYNLADNPSWPGWSWYEIQWTQVHGTNYHWEGSVICGHGPKDDTPPATPEPKVVYGEWTDGEIVCDATTVEQTRTVTTTPYKVVKVYGKYKVVEDTENATVTTETRTRDLTKDEQTTCPPTEEPTPGSIVATCTGATVTFPSDLPEQPYGYYTEVNILVTNLNTGDKAVDFNYYNPFADNPAGTTQFFDLSVENPGWPGWTWYEITKVTAEPGGLVWTGSIICGEESTTPEPPVVPEPNVVYGNWTDETIVCDATTVKQTRSVTTTPYKVVLVDDEYQVVLDTEHATVTTETRTRDLKADEQTTCPITPPTPPAPPVTPVTPVTPSTPTGPLDGGYFNTGDTVTATKQSVLKANSSNDDGGAIIAVGAFMALLATFGFVIRRRKADGTAE